MDLIHIHIQYFLILLCVFTSVQRLSMDDNWPVVVVVRRLNHLNKGFTGQRSMGTKVIEVTDFNYEGRCDLIGHLEAIMASEAT